MGVTKAIDFIKRGLRHPERIPPYIKTRLEKELYPKWERKGRMVKFHVGQGAFVGAAKNRPEFSSTLYYDVQSLKRALEHEQVETALELGCGYGRMTPWIAEHAEQTTAIDLSSEAVADGQIHYPDVSFCAASVTDLPFDDNQFDLVTGWTVLMHIPPEIIDDAVGEIQRVLTDDGKVVVCEKTAGETSDTSWPRATETYDELFAPQNLTDSFVREIVPETLSPDETVMTFE